MERNKKIIPANFSFARLWGLIIKEFNQMRRDQTTFIMIISIPLIQLILFGLAINTNPKNLPTVLLNYDNGPFSRTLVHELANTQYFRFNHNSGTETEANELMQENKALFILSVPTDFSHKLVRGERPAALLEVDGTDPVSVGTAISAANVLMGRVFQYDLLGPLQSLNPKQGAAELRIHTRYNPSAITQYNIVPGLLGVILTMTLVMVAAMVITREREQGTMEMLLVTPLLPIEVIIGKIIPFIIIGYIQVGIVILIATAFFAIPIKGSFFLLVSMTLPFILANLFVGIAFSTIAKTQLEASQTSVFFFLPSILLSGFAFPFYGMPLWAQWLGNILPLTHFVTITRGIMLKGVGFAEVWPDLWPLLLFMLVMLFIAVKRYRRTLD